MNASAAIFRPPRTIVHQACNSMASRGKKQVIAPPFTATSQSQYKNDDSGSSHVWESPRVHALLSVVPIIPFPSMCVCLSHDARESSIMEEVGRHQRSSLCCHLSVPCSAQHSTCSMQHLIALRYAYKITTMRARALFYRRVPRPRCMPLKN